MNFEKILGEPCKYVFKSGKKKGQACGIRRCQIKHIKQIALKKIEASEAEREKQRLKRRRQYYRQFMRRFFDRLAIREEEVFRNAVLIYTNEEREIEHLRKVYSSIMRGLHPSY